MAEKPVNATTGTALAATPTAGEASIADFRPILIVAGVSIRQSLNCTRLGIIVFKREQKQRGGARFGVQTGSTLNA